jgi:hypothetical protein
MTPGRYGNLLLRFDEPGSVLDSGLLAKGVGCNLVVFMPCLSWIGLRTVSLFTPWKIVSVVRRVGETSHTRGALPMSESDILPHPESIFAPASLNKLVSNKPTASVRSEHINNS